MGAFAKMTALVVEDQAFIRAVVGRILKQLEFETVLEAPDGTAGLEIVQSRRIDVIICDIEMAPMDGLTFLRHVKDAATPMTPAPPFAFLTSHAEKDVVLKAKELGVNAFIVKPVAPGPLREKLLVLLGARR